VRTAFFDIDTQIDFLFPAGALYVPGAERLIPAFRRLNRHAAAHGHRLVSSTCAHAENDAEFGQWPPHCVAGTVGQLKPAELLLEKRIVVPAARAVYALDSAQQVIVEKNQLDIFSNPNLSGLLQQLAADRYVVYGVVTEYCVGLCALGLLGATGKPVSLVTDAIRTLSAADGERRVLEFTAAGGTLTTVAEVCGQ
jgi:nicotinamidase/pyrazinamidase